MKLDAETLRSAVAVAREAGWTLKQRVTLQAPGKCLCPLGALALCEDRSIVRLVDADVEAVADALGISHDEANAFADGFDGFPLMEFKASARHPHLHALGAQLAKELLP